MSHIFISVTILFLILCNQFLVFMTAPDSMFMYMRRVHLTDLAFATELKLAVISSLMSRHGQFNPSLNALSQIEFTSVRALPLIECMCLNHVPLVVNLGGYTKGSRNEIFVVRPSPIQISLMGFAGTLAAGQLSYINGNAAYADCGSFTGWCDFLVCDAIACPEDLTEQSLVRDETTSRLYDDLNFGPSVGTVDDPEHPTDEWM
jgi:Glycosyl transferase family 41